MKNTIAPSILSANFLNLGQEISDVLDGGADWIHIDVMDNHYVPNLTLGPPIIKSIRDGFPKVFLDVHLMVKPVDMLIRKCAAAGASNLTIHPESTEHLDRSIELIKSFNINVGIALNPSTPLTVLDFVLDKIDLILIMTVNPGFGGQSFIPTMLKKISKLREKVEKQKNQIDIQVDGGINLDNIKSCQQAGANIFVSGSTIFNSDDYQNTIQNMKKAIHI